MLSVLFLILKAIGIVIVSVLALVLLLLLLILFVPIRYQLKFSRSGIEGEAPALINAKVTWLLHLLNIHADYPAKVYVRCKIFLFTIFKFPSDKKKDKTKTKKKKVATPEVTAGTSSVKKNDENEFDKTKSDILDDVDTGTDKAETEEKHTLSEKLEQLQEKIQSKIEAFQEKIIQIEEKKDDLTKQIEHYQRIIESNAFKESLALCKKELIGILKSISPRKVDVRLEVGMDDPATTATILSYYGMFYAYLYNKVHLVGNFEEVVIRGKGIIKGKITIAGLLFAGIRVYFNKNIRKLLRMLKKEENKNGRK